MGILRMRRDGLGVEHRWIDVHSVAGANDKCERKPDDESNRGHRLEIDQRLYPDASDLLEVASPGNAMNDHAEDDRRDDHRDQLEKRVAENLKLDGKVRRQHPKHNPEHQRGQHLDEQGPIKRDTGGRERCGFGRDWHGN
jgi:hypothetical protein